MGELTEQLTELDRPGESQRCPGLADDGRIPLRIRVGVTGHRHVRGDWAGAIHQALDRIQERLMDECFTSDSPATDLQWAVVSELALGADRMVVQQVFEYASEHGQDARLEVVLPMERNQYSDLQRFDTDSRRELEQLLEAATFHIEPSNAKLETHAERSDAYAAAGTKLIARCDVLIALWDGKPAPGKRGGTAHTLVTAAAQRKPCVWISTDDGETRDNLDGASTFFKRVRALSEIEPDYEPGDGSPDGCSLEPLSQVFAMLDEYNREPRPRAHLSGKAFARLARRLFDRLFDQRFERNFRQKLGEEIDGRLAAGTQWWLAAPFARASLLAAHYRYWFKRFSALVLASASLAGLALAVGVGTGTESWVWGTFESGFLLLALVTFLAVREFGFHSRWLSCRVLAERFRTARYVAPTGVDFRDQARLQGVWVGGRSEEWLMRAFEEVWDREPHGTPINERDLQPLKKLLAHNWVQGQIRYHRDAKEEHERLKCRFTVIMYTAFGLTVVFAALDAILAGLHDVHKIQTVSKALTIFLPVLGASVGAALTINQHRALAERSAKMQVDLPLLKADLESATDIGTLREATIAAARAIAPETGTWFGTLWFLDIEHP